MGKIEPLFVDEKRESIKIKIKPSMLQLAGDIYKKLYPFSEKINLDDLLEQFITEAAHSTKVIQSEEEKEIPVVRPVAQVYTSEEVNSMNDEEVVNSLLG